MRSNYLTTSIVIVFCMLSISLSSQDAWFTNLEEGVAYAKKENKLILLEIGILRTRNSTFIPNEIWTDSLVAVEVPNFVPVTIELDRNDPFIKKHAITVTPAIIILDKNKQIHYQYNGQLDSDELSAMLYFMHNYASQYVKLSTIYKDENSPIGKMQLAEESLFLAFKAPSFMKYYFYVQSIANSAGLENNFRKEGMDEFSQRCRIILLGQEIQAGDYDAAMQQLEKLKEGKLPLKNALLASFYLAISEIISNNPEKLRQYKEEIDSKLAVEVLARSYSEKLALLLDPIEK